MDAVDDKEDRSAYDARKSYINVIERILMTEMEMSVSGNLHGWVRALYALRTKCYSYCDRKKMASINERLEEASRLSETLRVVKPNFKGGVSKKLDELLQSISLDLHSAAAALMMPVSREDDDAFDEEDFAEGSDL